MLEETKSPTAVRMGPEAALTLGTRTVAARYKDDACPVEPTPSPPSPPLSPSNAFSTDGRPRLAFQKAIPPAEAHLLHLPARLPSSFPSPSFSSLSRSPRTGRLDHYNLSPILLTPPASTQDQHSNRTPTAIGRTASYPRYRNPVPCLYRLERNAIWPESPTLSVRRVRKRSQEIAAATSSLEHTAERISSSPGMHTMTCLSLTSSKGFQADEHRREHRAYRSLRIEGPVPATQHVLPPFKARAMTLDGTDRPTLPPMLGYTQPSQVGPIRTSPSRTFSASRHGSEHRSNPYFISTPARLPLDQTRSSASLSPSTRRGPINVEPRSPQHAPWTPTSSLRSTFGGIHENYFAASHSFDHAIQSTPVPLDNSPIESCPLPAVPTKKDVREYLGTTGAPHLPALNCVNPNNALGLYMEHPPFRPELLSYDRGFAGQRNSMLPYGCCAHGRSAIARNGQKTVTRSPAAMSDTLPLTPSPPASSDDPLPILSLDHRHDLEARSSDLTLAHPALSPHRPRGIFSPQPIEDHAAEKVTSENMYKMPILRAMSPLADMSSDSDIEEVSEALASSSTFPSSQEPSSQEAVAMSNAMQDELPREGCSGEIFAVHKSALPLTLKRKGSRAPEKLFCKLESTTHQCFSVVDGKWACYRRNYLKVDVCFHFEDERGRRCDNVEGELLCQPNKNKEPVTVERIAVHMTAHVIAPDGSLQKGRQGLVPLIQFGPARERGPREAVQPIELGSGGTVTRDATVNEQTAARSGNIAAFRRVQIRSATMNNGQRGSAGQQFYALKLTLLGFGKQSPTTAAAGVELASLVSHPITVRGRSKVHYAPAPVAGAGKRQNASAFPTTNAAGTRRTLAIGNRGTMSRDMRAQQSSPNIPGDISSRRSIRLLRPSGKPALDTMDDVAGEAKHFEAAPGSNLRPVNRVMDIRSVI